MFHPGTNRSRVTMAGRGQHGHTQSLNAKIPRWSGSCYLSGMRSNRGFTLVELMIALGVAGVLTAVAVPVFMESSARNQIWTASETIGSQIRQARLRAISRNRSYQVRFNCPAVGQFRVLVVPGPDDVPPAPINDAARCGTTVMHEDGLTVLDGGIFAMPNLVSFGDVPTLEVSSRGIFTSTGVIPQTITVTYGARQRTLTVSLTGQITFSTF
jgi:prepilin-type N-terminal cleavage/methylation domain-containing protein